MYVSHGVLMGLIPGVDTGIATLVLFLTQDPLIKPLECQVQKSGGVSNSDTTALQGTRVYASEPSKMTVRKVKFREVNLRRFFYKVHFCTQLSVFLLVLGFLFGHAACWISVFQPGIELWSQQRKGKILTIMLPGNSLIIDFNCPSGHLPKVDFQQELRHHFSEYMIKNAGLDEAQARIKIVRRNSNNLRYAGDTTFISESKEELESLDESGRGEQKMWLKAQHSEN